MVAFLERPDAGPHVDDDAGAFVPENDREQAFRIAARAREFVRVADARGLDLDQDFAGPGPVEVHRFNDEGLAGLVADSGAGLHGRCSVGGRVTGEPNASTDRLQRGPGRCNLWRLRRIEPTTGNVPAGGHAMNFVLAAS